jgi:hypothetical protein
MKLNLEAARQVLRDASAPMERHVEAAAVVAGAPDASSDDLSLCRRLGGLPSEFVRPRLAASGCIAILEDDTRRLARMCRELRLLLPAADVKVFVDSSTMIEWLRSHQAEADLICLDHDLNDAADSAGSLRAAGTGRDVSQFLCSVLPTCPVIVHSSNASAAGEMVRQMRSAGWPVRRVYPFDDLNWIAGDWIDEIGQLRIRGALPSFSPA